MKTKSILFIFLALLSMSVSAQKRTVKGKVVDNSGYPLEMVSVHVKGTNVVTYTERNGTYSISAAPSDTLNFSLLGYNKYAEKIEHNFCMCYCSSF